MFQNEMDLHTHTTASGHAYSTMSELIHAAQEKNLKVLGITEHAEGVPGTCCYLYFANQRIVPRVYENLRLLFGAEINILDYDGTLSMDEKLMSGLDLRLAGIHKFCYTEGTKKQNTDAMINAMKSGWVDAITHPDDGDCPLDYDRLTDAAKAYDVLLEVNNNSLFMDGLRKDTVKNNLEMLKLCKAKGVKILLSSDAHHYSQVGGIAKCLDVIERADFPEELIVNRDAYAFLKYLDEKHAQPKRKNIYPKPVEREIEA